MEDDYAGAGAGMIAASAATPGGAASVFYKAMSLGGGGGDGLPVWTWSQMVRQIGAKEVVERITNQMTNLGIVAALCLTMTMACLLEPPSPADGSDEDDYHTSRQVYGAFFAISTFCLAAATLLSVTVLIQLNTIRWDDANLIAALERNNCQNVVSVWSFQFFNIGIIFGIMGFNTTVWIVYHVAVFWVSVASTILIVGIGALAFAYNVADAFMHTWKRDLRGEFGCQNGIQKGD
jgi:hypothetical protein